MIPNLSVCDFILGWVPFIAKVYVFSRGSKTPVVRKIYGGNEKNNMTQWQTVSQLYNVYNLHKLC